MRNLKLLSFLCLLIMGWSSTRAGTFGINSSNLPGFSPGTEYDAGRHLKMTISLTGFTAYTLGNAQIAGSSGSSAGYDATTLVPNGGLFLKLTPDYDGTMAVLYSVHAGSTDKSVAAFEYDESTSSCTKVAENVGYTSDVEYTLNFDVKGGKTYYVYNVGATNQMRYKSVTYKINITDLRCRDGNEVYWGGNQSSSQKTADWVVRVNGANGAETAFDLVNYVYPYDGNPGGAYNSEANNRFLVYSQNPSGIIRIDDMWHRFSGTHYYANWQGIVPGSVTELTAYFPGNDDYNPATTTINFFVHKGWQGLSYERATDTYTYSSGLTINQNPLTQSYIHQTITYTSSNPAVATVNEYGVVTWTGHAGSTVITASVPGSNEWTAASASYTLTINGNAGPRIVWVTGFQGWSHEPGTVYDDNLENKDEGLARNFTNAMRGAVSYASYFTPKKVFDETSGKEVVKRIDNIFTAYNQNIQFNAYALAPGVQIPSWWKRMPTDNNKPDLECYYFVMEDNTDEGKYYTGTEETLSLDYGGSTGVITYDVKNKASDWVTYKKDWRPSRVPDASTFFYNGDPTNSVIQYSNSAGFVCSDGTNGRKVGGLNSHGGGSYYYDLKMGTLLSDSLEIYATAVPTDNSQNVTRSTIKIAVFGGFLQMSFEPKEVVVNEGNWIQPYLKFPDSPMGDFEKIYVTIDDGTVVNVIDMDQLFYNGDGADIKNKTTAEIDAICGDYIEWKWSYLTDENGNKIDGSEYPVITGIRPKIYGLIAGQETDVRVHLVSSKWSDTGAAVHVTVIAQNGDLFHFEMNDVNGSDVASMDNIGDIYMFEGDYIYMPGIVGNPNGNDEYSVPYTYKYLYAIQGDANGDRRIVLNRDGYFKGEGVANYYIAETDNGEPLIPENNMLADECNQKVLIFKEVGLGNYYRNDSLLLFGHKPGTMYLYAEDAQTGWRCKPLRIHVIPREGTGTEYGKASLLAQKAEMMSGMSYPFTWDFEHMDLDKIFTDASFKETVNGENGDGQKIAGGNGGSYWRKLWDNTERGSKSEAPKNSNWYQWNGVFNADHDDKDGNGNTAGTVTVDGNTAQSGMRQRWFKDITANGEYLSLFKGLMINIAGLDYWQQKYHRFRVNQKGTSIVFMGGVHFMSLPGFGATGNVGETYSTVDPTRPAGTVRMPNLHNQMNTNDNVTFQNQFGTSFTGSGYTAMLTDAQKRNNKVKFVIKARGGSNPVSEDKAGGVLYVGGKSMISTMVNDNGVRFSGHTDYDPATGVAVQGTRIPLFTEPKIYVVELDPWSAEFQEQIYLAMDGTVEIFWMGITTEPRNMRSDYNVFTYSYPKDIDMDKTNQVMKLLTNDIVSKDKDNNDVHGVELKTYYGDAFGGDKMTVKPIADYNTDPAKYKFGAYEGVFVYPSVDLNQLRTENKFTQANLNTGNVNVKYQWDTGELLPVNSGVTDVTSNTTAVTIDIEEKKDSLGNTVYKDGKPVYVAKTDPNGHYAYKQTTQNYTYSYLPVYFVANAENQDNYEANIASVQDNIARGREHTMDAVKLTQPYEHWEDRPATPEKYTDGLWYNQRRNKLNGNPFSKWQPQDYVSATDSIDEAKYTNFTTEGAYNGKEEWGEKEIDGEMVPRWVSLTMTNKFMIRYLKYEGEGENRVITKVLDEFLKDASGNVVSAQNGTGTGDPEYYYNLVGPQCVRFYRTFVPNYPKGRRASLALTWDQYNTNTFGKEGMFWNLDNGGKYANFPWVDYEMAKTVTTSADDPNDPSMQSTAKNGLQMVFLFDRNDVVSEDGGFLDGITEVENTVNDGQFYNLNGTRVNTPRRGVYIYNGRKVVIK